MVCIFSRGMLGVSALVIAAGCASAPSQQQTRDSRTGNPPTLSDDLQARSSGVFVHTAAGGGIRVVLASPQNSFGATTFTPPGAGPMNPKPPEPVALGGSEPLYVVDGVPYTPGPGGLLIGINPQDIASIKAVKDPTELALYGMRAGNGVIAITMKKLGGKSDSTKLRPRD